MLAALFAAQPSVVSRTDYVPDNGWRDNEWGAEFYEHWFARQLGAMREPPLGTPADLQGFAERFRLLVVPSFEPAYAYRLDFRQDGTATLRWVRLSGAGGYAPGDLTREGTRPLSRSELNRFRSALAAAKLGSVAREKAEGIVTHPDGTQDITICLDGTMFVFEHLDAAGRQYVTRNCGPDEMSLQRLANVIFKLMPRKRMN